MQLPKIIRLEQKLGRQYVCPQRKSNAFVSVNTQVWLQWLGSNSMHCLPIHVVWGSAFILVFWCFLRWENTNRSQEPEGQSQTKPKEHTILSRDVRQREREVWIKVALKKCQDDNCQWREQWTWHIVVRRKRLGHWRPASGGFWKEENTFNVGFRGAIEVNQTLGPPFDKMFSYAWCFGVWIAASLVFSTRHRFCK